jgi:hypothetical protein
MLAAMADLVGFWSLLATRHIVPIPPQGEEVSLSMLASINDAIQSHGKSAVHNSLRETLLRLGETHILANSRMARLIDLWEGIVGSARQRIEGHLLQMLGAPPDPALVSYVFRCLSGSAARRGRGLGGHMHYFEDVLERLAAGVRGRPLRCECCGYHFRQKDLSTEKFRAVVEAGFLLERSLFPGRANDAYKPIQRGGSQSLTLLQLDHVVPEETLGWADADNLEVLCAFCNQGKLAYRRPLEAISSFAVGALAEVPRGREFSTLKHQIVVSALRSQGGECSVCSRDQREVELTVRPVIRTSDNVLHGFAPWNLRTLCYACMGSLAIDEVEEDVGNDGGENLIRGPMEQSESQEQIAGV